jgi:hypothetical protein
LWDPRVPSLSPLPPVPSPSSPLLAALRGRERGSGEEGEGTKGRRERIRGPHNFFVYVNDKWGLNIFFNSKYHLNAMSIPRVKETRSIPPRRRHVSKTALKTVKEIKLHRF